MFKKIFWNRFAFWSVFFLLIQQLIVASSTIWIAKLSEAVVEGGPLFLYLTLFISSLFVVYIPGIFSAFLLEKAKSKAIYNYTQAFSNTFKCTPFSMLEKGFKKEKEPWLTNECSNVIEETYSVAYDSVATGLNTILNIIALCVAINKNILIGYLISFLILPFVSKASKNKLTQAALTFQNDRKNMAQALLSGWDNIVIGNEYNFSIWWKRFVLRWSAYYQSSAKAVLLTQLSSTFAVVLCLIPVAGMFVWIFSTTKNAAIMAALIATLPRQIQIIQHFQVLSTYTMHWHGIYARVKALIATLVVPNYDKDHFIKRIKTNEITVSINNTQHLLGSYVDFLDMLVNMKSGRVTLQGGNGAGKTTLINLVKSELGDSVFYLPTGSQLFFESIIDESLSTGQKVKACLNELKDRFLDFNNRKKQDELRQKIILLDEWDANLDTQNKEQISEMLDELSKFFCVVEITHRQDLQNQDKVLCDARGT